MADTDRLVRRALHIVVIAAAVAATPAAWAEKVEFTYTNSFDGTTQPAFALVPDSLSVDDPRPLLVLAHHAWGSRHSQPYYYPEIERRGWLMVMPELHGARTDGRFSMAAREAQHDLIDAVAWMKAHYPVDTTRVYLAGRSMGGILSAVTAAKYPGLFAAVVAGEGIYDTRRWAERERPFLVDDEAAAAVRQVRSLVLQEFGGPPSNANAFEYERQSAVSYASNLQYVPLILWHGTLDEIVPAEQSSLLAEAIQRFDPYQPDPHWLRGASHNPINLPPEWVLDQLQYHKNIGVGGAPTRFYPELRLVTDEAKRILWLTIVPAARDKLALVEASVTDGVLRVAGEHVDGVTIHLDHMPTTLRLRSFEIDTSSLAVTIRRGSTDLYTLPDGQTQGSLPDLWAVAD